MDTRIGEAIDRSLGEPPPAPPVEVLLERGRRTQRAWRVGIGSTLAGTVAVACVAVAALTSGGPGQGAPPISSSTGPASGPTGSPNSVPKPRPHRTPVPHYTQPGAPVTTRTAREGNSGVSREDLVDYGLDGTVYVFPGARLVRWVDNPYGLTAPARSDGVTIKYHGTSYFYVLLRSSDGSSNTARIARGPWCPTLQDWIHRQRATAETVR